MSDGNLYGPDSIQPTHGKQGPVRPSSLQPADNPGSKERLREIPLRSDASGEANRVEQTEKQNEAMREKLGQAVSQLNDFVQSVQRDLRFEVNDETGETVVRVIDQETDEVVRQIPDELAVRLAENLRQDEPLSLMNIKV